MRIGEVKKLLRSSELVRSNGVMLLGTFVVSVLNYAFYPILSRLLSAAMLGEVQIIIAITTQLMFVVSIIRTVTINVLATTSGSSAQNKFIKESEKALWRTVLAGSAVILAVTPFLKKFLQLNSSSLLLLLIPILILSAFRGSRDAYLRAHHFFKQAIMADVIVSFTRIFAAVMLVGLGLGSAGAIGGLVVGLVLSLFYAIKTTKKRGLHVAFFNKSALKTLREPLDTHLMRPHIKYAATVALVGVLQALMLVLDSTAAKHYFTPQTAGLYAGISIVGNIVLFATSSVAGVLVASVNSGIAHIYNVRKLLVSFGLLVFMGSFVTALFSVAPTFFVTLLLGQRYSVYAYLLPKVALTMLFLSVANLFFAYHIALRDIYIVFVALASITIMITSVVVGHGNLTQMINSILYSSVIVVLINIVRTTWWNVRKLKAAT